MKAACQTALLVVFAFGLPIAAQERVTPQQSRGGKPLGEPWDGVPDEVRKLLPPEWPLPNDLDQWQKTDRARTREIVLRCLGTLPARPTPLQVKVLSREERGDHVLERFQFHNGVDSVVGGVLLIPKERKGPIPVIIGLHGHGGSKETICTDEKNPQCVGPMLVKKGYVVAAIDTYFCGDRARKDVKGTDEGTLFKLNLWLGRSLWGLMLRDQQCLIDYLQTRLEVDKTRIGVTGMSMGGTGSWWLAAVDDRVQALVGVAGFTRYTELIAHNSPRLHGVTTTFRVSSPTSTRKPSTPWSPRGRCSCSPATATPVCPPTASRSWKRNSARSTGCTARLSTSRASSTPTRPTSTCRRCRQLCWRGSKSISQLGDSMVGAK